MSLSGFKPSCKDFSPGSASLISSTIAHQFHTSSTSDLNFSCKDFSPGFASLLSSIAANQFLTSSTRLSAILLTVLSNYLGGFNFNCKDFLRGSTSILSSTAPHQFHTNGFDFCCKESSTSLAVSSSLIPPHQSYASSKKTIVSLSTLSFHDRSSLHRSTEVPVYQFHSAHGSWASSPSRIRCFRAVFRSKLISRRDILPQYILLV